MIERVDPMPTMDVDDMFRATTRCNYQVAEQWVAYDSLVIYTWEPFFGLKLWVDSDE